ncbi:MAG: DUF4288 domain-containing protein [Clostridia bacterium]|nr:DUF4288 domain-containing protein [Clostridia bacterium]
MKYSVKFLFQYTVEGGETFFEESIVMFDADSHDDALQKADRYLRDNCLTEPYSSAEGKTVTRQARAVDCFSVIEEDDGTEVYSGFRINRTRMTETEFADLLTDSCTQEELLPLRRW